MSDEQDIKLQCGPSDQVQQKLSEEDKFQTIGSSSIKNLEPKPIVPILSESLNDFKSREKLNDPSNVPKSSSTSPLNNRDESVIKMIKPSSLKPSFTKAQPTISQIHNNNKLFIKSNSQNPDSKINTAILAGMVCGIGLVIVLINLGVLFICRRNLKKLLKTTKEAPRDDIIQDYFDAFNTLHNLQNTTTTKTSRTTLPPPTGALIDPKTFNTMQSQLRPNNNEDSLIHESAQLFYNPRSTNTQNSTSAFKPFNRDQDSSLLVQQQQLLTSPNLIESAFLIQQQILQQKQFQNQYDKMNHHVSKVKPSETDSNAQYAHTYESLDTLELPNRRNIVHLGVSGRNYRSLMPDVHLNGNELNNFNISTSSSSSGTSSTQQLIRNDMNFVNQSHQQQQQAINQMINLNELKSLMAVQGQKLNSFQKCLCGSLEHSVVSSNGCFLCPNNGSWSPDSAYYSSIPTLANYNAYSAQFSTQQQFNSFNTVNNDVFKSQIV